MHSTARTQSERGLFNPRWDGSGQLPRCSFWEMLILKNPLWNGCLHICGLGPAGYRPPLWLSEPWSPFLLPSLMQTIWGSGKHSSRCSLYGADGHSQVGTVSKLGRALLSPLYVSTWPIRLWAVAGTLGGALQTPARLPRTQHWHSSTEHLQLLIHLRETFVLLTYLASYQGQPSHVSS